MERGVAPAESSPFSLGDMLGWIRTITGFGTRRPGYAQDIAVEEWLEQRFESFGLEEVRREPVPVNRWQPSAASLSVGAPGVEIPCFAVPYTAWTGSSGIEAPLAYVGDGSAGDFGAADVAGRIAVVDARFAELSAAALKAGAHFVLDPGMSIPDGPLHAASWLIENFQAYYEAQARGAVAFLGVLADAPVDGCDHYVPYDGFAKGLPAAWIGREHGDALRQAAGSGASARFSSLGADATVDSHNVVGLVPGSTDEIVLLTCHHDAPFASAVEDASGLAVLLALAQWFGSTPGRLRRSLLFVASSGHFHGGVGNRVFVEQHRHGLLARTVAALGIEHIAEEAEPDGCGGYRLTGRPEVRAIFTEGNAALAGVLEREAKRAGIERTIGADAYLFGPEPPCDAAPYFTAGIASACHISGPLYLFDPHDTIDKVRVADLVPVTSFFAGVVEALDGIPAAELAEGLRYGRDDPPPPPPSWFRPPEAYLGASPS